MPPVFVTQALHVVAFDGHELFTFCPTCPSPSNVRTPPLQTTVPAGQLTEPTSSPPIGLSKVVLYTTV